MNEIADRSNINPEDTWDLSKLFKSNVDWKKEKDELINQIEEIKEYKGKLFDSDEILKKTLDLHFSFLERIENIYTYAHLMSDQNTKDANSLSLLQEAQTLYVRYSALSSFISPELMKASYEKFNKLISNKTFSDYEVFLKELERQREHTLSEAEEELLSNAGEILSSSRRIFGQLNDADLTFDPVIVNGEERPLTHGTYISFLLDKSRDVRTQAYTNYYNVFENHKHTLAATLVSNLKKDTFTSRVRSFKSSRHKGLFGDSIPEEVYDQLLSVVSASLPNSLHSYYELRKNISKIEDLSIFDTYVPIVNKPESGIKYDEAIEILSEALKPLGNEYTEVMQRGLTSERWVDKYENIGKRSGAYSSGTYNSPPYILMNYKDTSIESLYTLAHEAGHSMHSWYSNKSQNYVNHSYTIFVAEVASTCNEILLTDYLLKLNKDNTEMKAYLLNYQLDSIKGTFFRQTMFAEFENIIHKSSDSSEPLTVESFRNIYRSLLAKYFGSSISLTELDDLECFRIPHFYSSFYVFKYATGIAAAITLAKALLDNNAEARKSYLSFLSAGGSKYPLDVLNDAGVDLRSDLPLKTTIDTFKTTLKELCRVQDWDIPESLS